MLLTRWTIVQVVTVRWLRPRIRNLLMVTRVGPGGRGSFACLPIGTVRVARTSRFERHRLVNGFSPGVPNAARGVKR